MADFSTGAELVLEVDERSLSKAKSQIESELGNVSVGVNASTGGGGGSQLDAMLSATEGQRDNLAIQTDLAEERNEILFAINETLEDGGGMAGGGGGGTTILGGGGAAKGLLSSGAGALSALGAGSAALGGGVAAAGAGLLTETIIGLTGGETPGKRKAREESAEIQERRKRQQEQLNQTQREDWQSLDEMVGEFEWPEIGVEDILTPVESSVSTLTWNTPGPQDITNEISNSIQQFRWDVPTGAELAQEIAAGVDVSVGGSDINLNVSDITTEVTADLDNLAEDVLSQAESSIQNEIRDFKRQIQRAVGINIP